MAAPEQRSTSSPDALPLGEVNSAAMRFIQGYSEAFVRSTPFTEVAARSWLKQQMTAAVTLGEHSYSVHLGSNVWPPIASVQMIRGETFAVLRERTSGEGITREAYTLRTDRVHDDPRMNFSPSISYKNSEGVDETNTQNAVVAHEALLADLQRLTV